MNFPLLNLELRKNRLSAASIAAAFFVTLPVARLVASATGMESANALATILIAWTFVGLPFAAALIGATAGAGTAADEAAAMEALLPVPSARRAAASLAAAAVLLALTAALLLTAAGLGNVLAPLLVPPDKAFNWGRPFWQNMPITCFFACLVADTLAASWTLAYLIRHGVAGGLLGPLLVVLEIFGVGICLGFRIEHSEWVSPLAGHEMALMCFLVFVKLLAVPAAARLERRPRPAARVAALPVAALCAGPLAAWLMAGWLAYGVDGRVRLAEPALSFSYQSWYEDASPEPAALAASGRAAAVTTVRGGVLLAGKDGLRTMVPEEKSGIVDLLFRPFDRARLYGVLRDGRGRLWAQRFTLLDNEVWREADGVMVLGRRALRNDWSGLRLLSRRVVIDRYVTDPKSGSSTSVYASGEDYVRLGNKAPVDAGLSGGIAAGEKTAGVARVACDGLCLRGGSRTWRLPGKALSAGAVFPHWAGGRSAYLIPYADARGSAAALCRENGTVEIAWRIGPQRERGDFFGLPDGTLYTREPGDTLGLIGADGRVSSFRYGRLRPKGAPLDARPALVRRAGGRSWLIWAGRLIEARDDGTFVSERTLPGLEDFRALDAGLLFDDGRALRFLGWDGASRRLEKPRM